MFSCKGNLSGLESLDNALRTIDECNVCTQKVREMTHVRSRKGDFNNGPLPVPQDAEYVKINRIDDLSGITHAVGTCAPMQGACFLSVNIKEGIIKELLVESVGCSGMPAGLAIAASVMVGKNILQALNSHGACDAVNTAMKDAFKQIVYGRSQTAYSINGMPVGTLFEDLGKSLRSSVGTIYVTEEKGPRWLEMAEGYVTKLALDDEGLIIGYEFVNLGNMMSLIGDGVDASIALSQSKGSFGRFDEGKKYINPRNQ
jgi:NifU-like protein involved in Fe-S cluster formation